MTNLTHWQDAWQDAVDNEQAKQLCVLLKDIPDLDHEQYLNVLNTALTLAISLRSLSLLTEVFRHLSTQAESTTSLRAQALEAALELSDEQNSAFRELLTQLSNGEQVLVLATVLERSRQDTDPERQLYRLSLILDLIPEDVRSLYWSEAQSLALLGGDDAQLILLKLANRLSRKARRSTFEELSEAVARLKEPYKHAQANALLIELGVPMSFLDIRTALERARSIPDPMLRAMTESRLVELSGLDS